MVWNKDLPLGTKAGNLLDDDIRTNNYGSEGAVGKEHVFSTGGDQTGKHKFAVEDEATRDGDADYVAGSVSITTDTVSGQYVFTFTYDGTNWVTPLTAFLNNANDWVLGQYHTTTELTPGVNIASVWSAANIFTVTLGENSTLDNPTGMPTTGTKAGVWYYIITQHSTAVTLAFGNKFIGSPVIDDQDDSVSVLQCVMDDAGNIQAQFMARAATATVPGIVELATDAEALTGTDATRALTPDNLGQGHLTDWNDGYYRVIGTGADGTGLVEIFMTQTDVTDGATITLPVTMASANYNIQLTAEDRDDTYVIVDSPGGVSSRTTTGFDIEVDADSCDFVHIRVVGIIAAP